MTRFGCARKRSQPVSGQPIQRAMFWRGNNPWGGSQNGFLSVERKMIAIFANDDLRQKSGRGDGALAGSVAMERSLSN